MECYVVQRILFHVLTTSTEVIERSRLCQTYQLQSMLHEGENEVAATTAPRSRSLAFTQPGVTSIDPIFLIGLGLFSFCVAKSIALGDGTFWSVSVYIDPSTT